ncbi:UvrB/UvrC motif-containing protein [Lachnoclostridium phytofermentans]|uniref:UvrB/UvrC protein n=1 Tax=Lachnoclostridium phytofermentans (strain ATCC 700394 / DSM 18823 / ISDg) TaxID=357809 RepID=A9KHW7_LACP7|nr:UvrB/UvrC motif-containing protein [Lachnoclostridium phytofermentans]ABX43814.1 UvrB/UvrC protein [Lachnoclostridium phytofermentans ISDg]
MLCDICGKKEAKIYYTEILNGKKTEQHLCSECAAKNSSFLNFPQGDGSDPTLGGMLFELLESIEKQQNEEEIPITKCKSCGLSYEEFLKQGKFGCADCYSSFGKVLNKNFRSIHGADTHTGKKPKGYESEMNRLINELSEEEKLTIQLQQAIEQEEYEEAARIRDRIRELKKV